MKVGFYIHKKKYLVNFKSRLTMALMLLLCFVGNICLAHKDSQIKGLRTVTIKLESVNISKGLTALEKKADCSINYNKSIFRDDFKVSLDVKDMALDQVLRKMLSGTRVTFRFADEQTVLLYKLPDPVKPGKITGQVVDEKGEVLPGASVRIMETGAGIQAGADGGYILSVNPGTYTLEISYISYRTQRVTGVVVVENKSTPLNISLKPDSKGLKELVVTANYRKASVEGVLARQKNASEISNGISSEQISRTPDKNIGESLKRISGLNTIDNKYVLVRGIGERYNSAMLDGTVLPSTEAQSRNFSFDLIPSNMVDNVVVSKTVTPDMNASFGGGLIQINTKDIPNENFMSFSAGASFNDQATGKEFISHKRGKYDYFGFDDGRRDFPKDILVTTELNPEQIREQSRRFTNDNFTLYHNKALPSQNYQFAIGKLLVLDATKDTKLGFTGSISYRNTQSNNIIGDLTRGDWSQVFKNTGNAYGFNTTLGGLLNVGLQLGKNRFSFRNTYTHLYDNTLYYLTGYSTAGSEDPTLGLPPSRIQETDDPTYTDLLQNKLSGQHQVATVKLEWNAARTSVSRQEKDLIIAERTPRLIGGEYLYYYIPTDKSEPRINPLSRHNYRNKEQHYSWDVAATLPFTIGQVRSTVKTGYFGNQKKGAFDWVIAALTKSLSIPDSLQYLPISEIVKPENMGPDGFEYSITRNFMERFEGKSHTHAGFIMFDNRLMEKLRLVWGIRGEYYKYTEKTNASNSSRPSVYTIKPDPRWQWLPSVNLTYSPLSSLNIRTAYSSSVVRPELMDNSQFLRFSPILGGQFGNQGLYSTRINSTDLKIEWFPGLGEILSAGGFYKKFDKPTETVVTPQGNTTVYYLKSSDWAKVYGLELELRKNLSFISDAVILKNLTLYGNLTLQKSEVRSTYLVPNPTPGGVPFDAISKQSRPMYGQTPYLINAGLQYNGNHLGLNLMYNKSGFKTYLVSEIADRVEYERPREQVDAQVSYRFLKNKLEIRINAGNLLNGASRFYRNTASYEPNPDAEPGGDLSSVQRLKPGFTNKYEDGDRITFSQKFGRTYSTTLTWNF